MGGETLIFNEERPDINLSREASERDERRLSSDSAHVFISVAEATERARFPCESNRILISRDVSAFFRHTPRARATAFHRRRSRFTSSRANGSLQYILYRVRVSRILSCLSVNVFFFIRLEERKLFF